MPVLGRRRSRGYRPPYTKGCARVGICVYGRLDSDDHAKVSERGLIPLTIQWVATALHKLVTGRWGGAIVTDGVYGEWLIESV